MPKFKEKKIFKVESIKFSETEDEKKEGFFHGILVSMENTEAAKGMFLFNKGSMEGNNGKKLFMLYDHNGQIIPIGTMTGTETEKGFEIEGKFDLNKGPNGGYINEEAAKIYSLLKNEKAPFELSVGGNITEYKERMEDGKYIIDILKFDAYEGSITTKAAVRGSVITTVFNKNNNLGGTNKMNKEMLLALEQMFSKMQESIMSATATEEVRALPIKFKELEENFKQAKEQMTNEVSEKYEAKFNELNEVIKGLKVNYIPTAKEFSAAEQFAAMIEDISTMGIGKKKEFSKQTIINFANPATTTGDQAAGIRTDYATEILERIQESNPIVGELNFIPTTENSYTLVREMLGLPETGWVGETAPRAATEPTKLDRVTVQLNQLYAMPVVSNKLLGTNFVGYANFLMKRVEYALGLRLANSILSGSGTNSPLGILEDTNVTQFKTLVETDDATFIDSLLDAYYSVKTDIAATSKWYMPRSVWARIAKLKNITKDFYITDLNTGNTRTLMNAPVITIESVGSGLAEYSKAVTGDVVALFADLNMGILAIQNPNLTMYIKDEITEKGMTKFWTEKGVGAGVQLPECFTKIVKA